MKLNWNRGKKPVGSLRQIRAAVMPLTFNQPVTFGVTENNLTVNSISTHIVDLQPLEAGQTAEDVAPFAPGTMNAGGPMISKEEAVRRGIQRAQFDAPNWIGVLVASNATSYVRNIDIPVWVDESFTIQSVDVEKMLAELEPLRKQASEVWGQKEGVFADFHQVIQAPKHLFRALKSVAAIPGELKDIFNDLKGKDEDQLKPADPVPVHFQPNMSQYPPVDGMDYRTLVIIQANPDAIPTTEFTDEARRFAALKVWNDRVLSDWKLQSLFASDVDRLQKGAKPSWDQ